MKDGTLQKTVAVVLHSSLAGDKTVDYQGCDVDTTEGGINATTGAFTAKKKGIYRFHFQARVNYRQTGYVDIMKGSAPLARMGNVNTNSQSSNTMSCGVVTTMEVGEQVHVQLIQDSYSNIYSDAAKFIVFEGFLLAPL